MTESEQSRLYWANRRRTEREDVGIACLEIGHRDEAKMKGVI